MAKEQKAAAPASATAPVVNSLFSTTLVVDESKFKRRNTPQLVRPSDIPVGGGINAEIVDVVDSPVTTVKGKLLWLKQGTQEFTFPCIGDIRSALAPGKKDAELEKALKSYIGKTLVARRAPDKAGEKKNIKFDVFTN